MLCCEEFGLALLLLLTQGWVGLEAAVEVPRRLNEFLMRTKK
jgi:hypothetical protein